MKRLLVVLIALCCVAQAQDTFTPTLGMTKMAHLSHSGNWDSVYNANFDILDAAFLSASCGDVTHVITWDVSTKKFVCVTAPFAPLASPTLNSATLAGTTTATGDFNIKSNKILQEGANCAAGTVVNKLVKWSSAAGVPCLTITGASETNTAIGICVSGCGNSGTAQYAVSGNVPCVFDALTTVNDFVQQSATTGQCSDTGSATVTPSGVEIIGRVQSTNGGAGTYTVNLGATLDVVGGGGSGNVPGMSSATQGAACLTNNGSVAAWCKKNYLYVDQFTGTTGAEKLVACLARAHTNNADVGVCDASGLTTTTDLAWDEDPFTVAGTNIPLTCLVILPGAVISMKYGPLVQAGGCSIIGLDFFTVGTIGTNTSGGSVIQAATTYPNSGTGVYTTGTITVGTVGANEVITGAAGASWTNNVTLGGTGTIAPGCVFEAPANPTTVGTYGVIKSIDSTTQITLWWGENQNAGAATAGSSYVIHCPVLVAGNGGVAGTATYSMGLVGVTLDANSRTGVVPYVNFYGQQSVYAKYAGAIGFCGIGWDFEQQYFYQAGPYEDLHANPSGTCKSAGTMDFVIRPNGSNMYGFKRLGVYGTTLNNGIDLSGFGTVEIDGADGEGPAVTVNVNDALTCNPGCAMVPHRGSIYSSIVLRNIGMWTAGTAAVQLSSTNSINPNVILESISGGSGTNTLIDNNNGCTIPRATENRLAFYNTDVNGKIGYSTSNVAACNESLRAGSFVSQGTTFTASGCGNTTRVGGPTAGRYTSVTAGSCAITITMGLSTAAPNGWMCDATDLTTAADAGNILQTGGSTTTAIMTEGTVVANDVIAFKCTGY